MVACLRCSRCSLCAWLHVVGVDLNMVVCLLQEPPNTMHQGEQDFKEAMPKLKFPVSPLTAKLLARTHRAQMEFEFERRGRSWPGGLVLESVDQLNGDGMAVVGGGVALRPSQIPNAGLGLYADKVFNKGDRVTQYCGPILGHGEVAQMPAERTTHCRSLRMQFDVIDGISDPIEVFGQGGASFCNDPLNTDLYNCEMRSTNELGDVLFLVAKGEIKKGEEIFWSYGNRYWQEHAWGEALLAEKDELQAGHAPRAKNGRLKKSAPRFIKQFRGENGQFAKVDPARRRKKLEKLEKPKKVAS